MTTIVYKDCTFKVTSSRQGVAYPWGQKYEKQHHRIFMTLDKVRVQFEFYCNNSTLTEHDLRFAVYCFLSDAIAYKNARDFKDFCAEFGYEVYNYKGQYNGDSWRTYIGCRRQLEKWESLTDIDIYEFCNWLQDTYEL